MTQWTIPITAVPALNAVTFDTLGNALWFATGGGQIRVCRLYDGREWVAGDGYGEVCGVSLGADGLRVHIATTDGQVTVASRDDAGRSQAAVVFDAFEPMTSMAAHPDKARLLVLTAAGGLYAVDPTGGTPELLTSAFDSPLAMSVDGSGSLVVVLEDAHPGRRVRVLDLVSGTTRPPLDVRDAAEVIAAVTYGTEAGVHIYDGTTGLAEFVGLDGQPDVPESPIGARVLGSAIWQSVVIALTSSAVIAREWGLEYSAIDLSLPIAPLFVGGFSHADCDLGAAGLTAGDVELFVEEGETAGFVSAGLEPAQAPGQHRFVVGAGLQPGEYHLACRKIGDGIMLARARFRVTSHWPDRENGPGIAVTGKRRVFTHGSWGGGPNGPQNINVVSAPETWRVLIVLVELNDRTFGNLRASARSEWRERLIGNDRSVRTFYEEASRYGKAGPSVPRGTTVELVNDVVHLPVHVDAGWADVFEKKDPDRKSFWTGWNPKPTFWQQVAAAISDKLASESSGELLRQSDAVVAVVRTASDMGVAIASKLAPALYVWPQAFGSQFYVDTPFGRSYPELPMVFMPDSFPASMPGNQTFDLTAVLAHELGHTLGLEDLYNRRDLGYTAEVMVRDVASLDLMSAHGELPHFSLANKMRLGWIGPTWIERFDFGQNPKGRSVVLHAMEALTRNGPPPGRAAGIEVRLQDGWNYYFEYRRTIAGGVGDQSLAATDGGAQLVVGTDVRPDGKVVPVRPVILRLPLDADGDGPVLMTNGANYEETDVTNLARQHDFRLVFDHIDAADPNAAHVRVEYVAAHRPQLEIAPPLGRGSWKSDDIDLVGPAGDNRIAKGLKHQIVARIRNKGSLGAKNVRVSFAWLPFTTSPGTWNDLGAAPLQDVAAFSSATFVMNWLVPAVLQVDKIEVEHFCVRVSIDRYIDPLNPAQSEIVIFDNWAQSNFDTQDVAHGSPSDRRWTALTVSNPAFSSALFRVVPESDSDHFRLFVRHAWLQLQRNETRTIPVGYESLAGDPVHGAAFERAFRNSEFERPAQVSFNAFVVPPDSENCASAAVVWGAGLALRPGNRTSIEDVRRTGEAVRGWVRSRVDGVTTNVTHGDVHLVLWWGRQSDNQRVLSTTMESTGRFTAVLPEDILDVIRRERLFAEVIYLGTSRYALSRTTRISLV